MPKIQRTPSYIKTFKAAKINEITAEALAEGIKTEMNKVESRMIAKEKALENLGKDPDYYKKQS